MTSRAHPAMMIAAVLLGACGDDGTLEEAGRADAALAMESAFQGTAGRKVGGTVSGLAGVGLGLALNGDETLAVQANGRFHFDQKLSPGATYSVTVKTQPSSVVQTCTVSNGTGVIGRRNVKSVLVICSPTGRFVRTGDLVAGGRFNHSATRLADGKVLIAGGYATSGSADFTASAELYDPVTGVFTATGSMSTPRDLHSATLLPNGKVLIAGGTLDFEWTPKTTAELYDPSTQSFAPTGSMNRGRVFHTATLLTTGEVLVVGGYAGDFVRSNSAELYDAAAGTFTLTGSPVADRYGHIAALAGGGTVLVAGGSGSPLIFDAVRPTFPELYDPATAAFSSLDHSLDQRRLVATTLADGKALIAGDALAEIYDPATGQFGDAGAHACVPRTATLLANDVALFVSEDCAEIFDPRTASFTPTDAPDDCLPTSATALEDGHVLITCSNGSAQLFEVLPPVRR